MLTLRCHHYCNVLELLKCFYFMSFSNMTLLHEFMLNRKMCSQQLREKCSNAFPVNIFTRCRNSSCVCAYGEQLLAIDTQRHDEKGFSNHHHLRPAIWKIFESVNGRWRKWNYRNDSLFPLRFLLLLLLNRTQDVTHFLQVFSVFKLKKSRPWVEQWKNILFYTQSSINIKKLACRNWKTVCEEDDLSG